MSKEADSQPGKGGGFFGLGRLLDRAAEFIDEKTGEKPTEPEESAKSQSPLQPKSSQSPASVVAPSKAPLPLPTLSSLTAASVAPKPRVSGVATKPIANADANVVAAIREKIISDFPLIVAYLTAADSALAKAIADPSIRKTAILQTIGGSAVELRAQIQQAQAELEREIATVKSEQEQEFSSYTQPDVDEVGKQQLVVTSAQAANEQARASLEQSIAELNTELEDNIRRLRDGARVRVESLKEDTARFVEQQGLNSSAAAASLAESQLRIAAARANTDAKIGKFEASAQVVASELTTLLTAV